VKVPRTRPERDRIERERAWLARAAHPGIVELVGGAGGDELRTRDVGGPSLADIGLLPAAEIAGLGSAAATILADLHDLGIAHGAVTDRHILIGADGRPVMCGLADAGPADRITIAADVVALARSLADHLDPVGSGRLHRVLRRPTPRRTPSARAFAQRLRNARRDSRLPAPEELSVATVRPGRDPGADPDGTGGSEVAPRAAEKGCADTGRMPVLRHHPLRLGPGVVPTGAERRGRRRRRPAVQPFAGDDPTTGHHARLTLVAAVALVATAVAGVVAVCLGTDPPVPPACPVADAGCVPVVAHDGHFVTPAGAFAVDVPGAVVVLGRWSCRPEPLPAMLDPATGEVWVWPAWPSAHRATTAAPAGDEPGAASLRVVPGRSGCDRIAVLTAHRTALVIAPRVAS
jgi:hypothetical protein